MTEEEENAREEAAHVERVKVINRLGAALDGRMPDAAAADALLKTFERDLADGTSVVRDKLRLELSERDTVALELIAEHLGVLVDRGA